MTAPSSSANVNDCVTATQDASKIFEFYNELIRQMQSQSQSQSQVRQVQDLCKMSPTLMPSSLLLPHNADIAAFVDAASASASAASLRHFSASAAASAASDCSQDLSAPKGTSTSSLLFSLLPIKFLTRITCSTTRGRNLNDKTIFSLLT